MKRIILVFFVLLAIILCIPITFNLNIGLNGEPVGGTIVIGHLLLLGLFNSGGWLFTIFILLMIIVILLLFSTGLNFIYKKVVKK
jgi:hypothetical protein